MSIESRSNQYGTVFEHWQIKEPLGSGSGGRSMVFRLHRADFSQDNSALKVISLIEEKGKYEQLSAFMQKDYQQLRQECREKATKEVELMAQLRGHTHIVDYLDHKFVDWSDQTGFGCDMLIRMERLQDLRGLMRDGEVFTEAKIIKIGLDICEALKLCHGKSILHRDIKPENIFRSSDGYYKLGDFGISRILDASPTVRASTDIGTPAYSAPEQLHGAYDMRVDLYSLGLVLYELANGNKLPFAASSYIREGEIQKRQMGLPIPPLSGVSRGFNEVILKACAFRPEDRYQSILELRRALEQILYRTLPTPKPPVPPQPPVPPIPPEPPVPPQPPQKDKRLVLSIMALAAAILCLCAAVIWMFGRINEADESSGSESQSTAAPREDTLANRKPAATAAPDRTPTEAPTQAPTEAPTEAPTQPPVTTRSVMGQNIVAAGRKHTAIMLSDGTAIATGANGSGQCDVFNWTNLTAIVAGDHHTVGLRKNGTVLATGHNKYGQCDVSGWSDVASIAAGDYHTVALLEDGGVLATGWNTYDQCNVSKIYNAVGSKEIIAVAAGYEHTVVLCEDGTVAAIGRNDYGQCNVSGWTDIIAIYAGTEHTVGLRSDGTVVATGRNKEGQCNVSGWEDVACLTAGDYYVVGITEDGDILTTGHNNNGQLDIHHWKNLIAIGGGCEHTVAIAESGDILANGWNDDGQCAITGYYYS